MAPKDETPQLDPATKAILEAQEKQNAMLATILSSLLERQGDTSVSDRLTEALERITGSHAQTMEIMANARKQEARPSNMVAPMRSVLNPQGETAEGWTKPRLVCEMHIPWRAENEDLTVEEVQLLNLIVNHPGSYVIQRNDDSRIKLSVTVEMDESGTKPTIMRFRHDTAFRNEYRNTIPSLAKYLRQILSQCPEETRAAANRILTMDQLAELVELGTVPVSV